MAAHDLKPTMNLKRGLRRLLIALSVAYWIAALGAGGLAYREGYTRGVNAPLPPSLTSGKPTDPKAWSDKDLLAYFNWPFQNGRSGGLKAAAIILAIWTAIYAGLVGGGAATLWVVRGFSAEKAS